MQLVVRQMRKCTGMHRAVVVGWAKRMNLSFASLYIVFVLTSGIAV